MVWLRKLYIQKLKDSGKCYNHPKENIAYGRLSCQKCIDKDKENYIRLKLIGKCSGHPNENVAPGKTHCHKCSWNSTMKLSNLNIIYANEKLTSQNYICNLSGRTLIKGENASPDHIIPIGSKNRKNINHPLNNISNIQFVDTQVNLAKQDYSDEDFIKMCEEVTNYQKNKRMNSQLQSLSIPSYISNQIVNGLSQ